MRRCIGNWLGLTGLVVLAGVGLAGCGDDDGGGMAGCGDGIVQEELGEECDDGNLSGGDGCSFNCTIEPVCGDGEVMSDEECDDGNLQPGDGCSADCTAEACGNGRIDPGESCDDGNTMAGDGCDADCLREAYCGDGMTDDLDEACDPGGTFIPDDMCTRNCQDVVCGNGVVEQGEDCDDGNEMADDGCSPDCLLEDCGNGTVEAPEQCDAGEMPQLFADDCGPDCRQETSFIVSEFSFATSARGCDMTGDGMINNGLAQGLGDNAINALNSFFVSDLVSSGDLTLLVSMLGLDDLSGQDDPFIGLGLLPGEDADDNPDNNFGGMGEFEVSSEDVSATGVPTFAIEGGIEGGSLTAGPADVEGGLPLGAFSFESLLDVTIEATTAEDDGEISEVSGLLCTAVPMSEFATATFGFGGGTPCDPSVGSATLIDTIVGGTTVMGVEIGPGYPDIDVDGDGLETLIVDRGDEDEECQAVVVGCVDGDGTQIDGRECLQNERIADGFSVVIDFSAVRADIVGTFTP